MATCEAIGKRLRDIEDAILHPIVGETERLVISNLKCLPSTQILDLVIHSKTADKTVISILSNKKSEIPHGPLGVVIAKTSATDCTILIRGRLSGFSGLQRGLPLFVSTTGWFTHAVPTTGVSHELGTAMSATEIIYDPKQPMKRHDETP